MGYLDQQLKKLAGTTPLTYQQFAQSAIPTSIGGGFDSSYNPTAAYAQYLDQVNQAKAKFPKVAASAASSTTGDLYGLKTMPQYQTETTTSNLATLPALEDLSKQVNEFNLAQRTAQLTAGLPQYKDMVGQSSKNIVANLEGQVDPDVQRLLRTQGAEWGVGTGMPAGTYGSTMPNYRSLLTLGLTSQQRKDLGEQQLTNAIARTPSVELYSPAAGLVTPAQSAEFGLAAAGLGLQRDKILADMALKQALIDSRSGRGGGGGVYSPVFRNASQAGAVPANQNQQMTVPFPGPVAPTPNTTTTITPTSGTPWAPDPNAQIPDYLSGYTMYQTQPTDVTQGFNLPSYAESQDSIWSALSGIPSYGSGTAFGSPDYTGLSSYGLEDEFIPGYWPEP